MLVSSLFLSVALSSPQPVCAWTHPGQNSFTGPVPAAVDRYTDIPPDVRERLKARMERHAYEDVVDISRDRIAGSAQYAPQIRDMHFGSGQVCNAVDRSKWTDHHRERGLVYCEDSHCILVPTVCRNVSRIVRTSGPPPAAGGTPPNASSTPPEELPFEPPSAGAPNPPAEFPLVPPSTLVPPLAAPPALSLPPTAGVPPGALPPVFTLPPGGGGAPLPPLPPAITPPIVLPPPVPNPGGPPSPPIPVVPEPATVWMALLGVAALGIAYRRRHTPIKP